MAEISSYVAELTQELRQKRVAAIVGSGISQQVTGNDELASWKGLLRNGLAQCIQLHVDRDAHWEDSVSRDLESKRIEAVLAAAEKIEQGLKSVHGEYFRWLLSTVAQLRVRNPEVIRGLDRIDCLLATTNYDTLIEQVTGLLPIAWPDHHLVEAMLGGKIRAVLHLHGNWLAPDSIVLGNVGYAKVHSDQRAQNTLRTLCTARTLLFIGCGGTLDDPNLGGLTDWSRVILSDSPNRHYRLALDKDVATLQSGHNGRGDHIRVVPFGRTYEDLGPFLNDLANALGKEHRSYDRFCSIPVGAISASVRQTIERAGATRVNPDYVSDLLQLDGNFDLDNVISVKTVLIVIGTSLIAELLDRTAASRLRDVINSSDLVNGDAKCRAIVLSDVYYRRLTKFSGNPAISIGSEAINTLTAEIRSSPLAGTPWGDSDKGQGVYEVGPPMRAALWGANAIGTLLSVDRYCSAENEGLRTFLLRAWA